jgi:hypothetical protein
MSAQGMPAQGMPAQGMFSNIEDDRGLLDLYTAYTKKICTPDEQYEGMTKECLIYLLKKKYDERLKRERGIPEYVELSPFVDKDKYLAKSIINTDSWNVYGYRSDTKEDTKEYEHDSNLENQFYHTSFRPLEGSKEMMDVRPYYLNLLFNLEQKENIEGVYPVIRRAPPPMQTEELRRVDPPMQTVEQQPISVSISPPRRKHISESIGGDRHKRAQIKAKSSKKRAQKKSSKKRINKNKNKRRTRSRKVLK